MYENSLINTAESAEVVADIENDLNTSNENQNDSEMVLGIYAHEFKQPFKYAGKTYKTLDFYFENLTGNDMLAIEKQMQDENEFMIAPEYSRRFQCLMASKAGNIGEDVLKALPINAFNKITRKTRLFLLNAE